jgi:hypothetical protein
MDRVMGEVDQRDAECFAYADDVAQLTDGERELIDIMNMWDGALGEYGLKLSYEKTKYMMVGRGEANESIAVHGRDIERVDKFDYLGSVISHDGRMEPEIDNRISKYSRSVSALYPLLKERNIPTQVRVHIFNAILKPILLYGCETWVLTERLKSKVQAAEMRVLRLIVGVTRRDRLTNNRIREILKLKPIVEQVEQAQLRWYGHVRRMNQQRDVRRIHDWHPHGRRPRGRPRRRWSDGIGNIVSRVGMDLDAAEHLAQDRTMWRTLIRELPSDRLL